MRLSRVIALLSAIVVKVSIVEGKMYGLPDPVRRYAFVAPIQRPARSTTSATKVTSADLGTPPVNAPIYAADYSPSGYFQPATNPQYIRNATCTWYDGCSNQNACGLQPVSGYTAALSQYSFGSSEGFGGACGRCFRIQGYQDPFNPMTKLNMPSIVVKVTDSCPVQGNPICAQSKSKPLNSYGALANFDLCSDSGAKAAFFTDGIGMCLCAWQEVSCTEWNGSTENTRWWNGCLATAASLWPSTSGACANYGVPPQ